MNDVHRVESETDLLPKLGEPEAETPEAIAYSRGFTHGQDQTGEDVTAAIADREQAIAKALELRAQIAFQEADKHRRAGDLLRELSYDIESGRV